MSSAGYITSEQPRSAVTSATATPRDSRRSSAQSGTKQASSVKLFSKRAIAALKKHHLEVNAAFDAVHGSRFYK